MLRKIDGVSDGDIPLQLTFKLSVVHDQVKQNIEEAFKKSSERYNLRTRDRYFNVGDTVYARQHPQSNAAAKFCSKFTPQFCGL